MVNAPAGPRQPRAAFGCELALLTLTALVYAPVLRDGFMAVDDVVYVVANAHVQGGLAWSTVGWAFGSFAAGNWHPLTWLSHALDWQLFHLWAGGHHASSLALHLVTVALTFSALRALTGAVWRSLVVAALFAVHPMNVQSVAWIAERKNVLSGALFAALLLAYAAYARHPGARRYLAVTGLFALGLMAKPMLVTVPFVLLLLDAWPLGRLRPAERPRALAEKVPWIVMAAASSIVTLRAQSAADAVVTTRTAGLADRVCVATAGNLAYLEKLFWPARLAAHYPMPDVPCAGTDPPLGILVLLALAAAALAFRRRWPWLPVGLGWFIGMLVPVNGLVQVGSQFIADRYVYLPMIGLGLAVVWGAAGPLRRAPPAVSAVVATAVTLALAARSAVEVRYWRTDEALYERALEVTGPNCVADTVLGGVALARRDPDRALFYWTRAAADCPGAANAHRGAGALLAQRGDFAAAETHLRRAVALEPDDSLSHFNLGLTLWYQGRIGPARAEFERTLALVPGHGPARAMLRRIDAEGPPTAR